MRNFFYTKLAFTNMKKNGKTYVPYMLTGIITIAMNYIIWSMSFNPGILKMPGADDVRLCIHIGIIVVTIFSCIFLFYTNSFLMKQRKKELGVYNVLGLGKRHLAKLMACETFFIAVIDLSAGILGGIAFSRLMFLVLYRLVHLKAPLTFALEPRAFAATILLFGFIFIICMLYNIWQVWRVNTIELLHGGNVGEREPKTKYVMTLIGVLTLGAGYYLALTLEQPLDAFMFFFLAVFLVIIGTYCLFTAGSVFLLKMLRRNKTYYYKTNHFISVSGMIYRMKQNAVGLANICILSTMVLVMISTTVSLYRGIDDVMMQRYPFEFCVGSYDMTEEEAVSWLADMKEETKKADVKVEREAFYQQMLLMAEQEGENNIRILAADDHSEVGKVLYVELMPVKYYNQLYGKQENLAADEVLVHVISGSADVKVRSGELQLGSRTLQAAMLADWPEEEDENAVLQGMILIVPDGMMEAVYEEGIEENLAVNGVQSFIGMDFKGDEEKVAALTERLTRNFKETGYSGYAETRESNRASFEGFCGGFLFLGIFFGSLFLMATVLIIYYKQISEGYDDRERFQIMQKVGMSKQEVRKSIRSQVVSVFALPLVVAVMHIVVAFKIITKLLSLFNMTNVELFRNCTIATVGVFAGIYVVVYVVTAREYYRVVR